MVELLAPLPKPSKFLAIGMNYKKHEEEGRQVGEWKSANTKTWFNKQVSCINDRTVILILASQKKLDYEGELGLVIGKKSKHLTKENVGSAILAT